MMKILLVISRIGKMPMNDVARLGVSNWIRSMLFYEHRRMGAIIPRQDELAQKGGASSEAIIKGKKYKGGLVIEPIELIELIDRIHREDNRVRYHYVIADYLCRVTGGQLLAASDADAVRWVERVEWNSHSALRLDPVTVRVIEKGWQMAQALKNGKAVEQ